jgi:hypothetical protein
MVGAAQPFSSDSAMSANTLQLYYIRGYQPGDETAIITLFSAVFGQSLTLLQWRWKYTGAGLELPLAKLAFDASGRLVGHAGAIPLQGWRRGRIVPFFQVCDVMVAPDARGQLGGRNLFTRLARELLDELAERWPDAFAYGFAGRRPFRLGEYARVYGRIEQAQRLICSASGQGMFPFLRIHPLAWNDPQLDALWTRLAPDFRLALARDQAYLHWRYASNPFHLYELLGLSLESWLLGWAVVRRENDRLKVIDLLAAPRWLKPIMATLAQAAATTGATRMDVWLPASWRIKSGVQQEATQVIVCNMIWKLPIASYEAARDLYYTMGDVDIF